MTQLREVLCLADGDQIIGAWCESCAGPGWGNALIWVLVCDQSGKLQLEAIQPKDRTAAMHTLFPVAEAASRVLIHEIKKAVAE